MRFEFGRSHSVTTLLDAHNTLPEKFSPAAFLAIDDSLIMAKCIGKDYASIEDLLLRLSMEDQATEENTLAIMRRFGLTTRAILSAMNIEEKPAVRATTISGVEPDYRLLLTSIDYDDHLYPGLPKDLRMPITQLDLLHNAVMWTNDSAKKVFDNLSVDPLKVVNACRVERWATNPSLSKRSVPRLNGLRLHPRQKLG